MVTTFSLDDSPGARAFRLIAETVRRAGGTAWLVGGAVRDLLLSRQPQDWDIEVTGLPVDQLDILLRDHFTVQFVGRAFGIFKIKGLAIDVSVPSRLSKNHTALTDIRHQADPAMAIDEALARRDFTINAMAWNPCTSELRDPFNGREDLAAHVLRHVSDRFVEDPLRVLRGMQLAARFELIPAPETIQLCGTLSQDGHPTERIWEEWKTLLLEGVKPSLGLTFLRDSGWLRFYPELAALQGCPQDPRWHPEGDVWIHTLHCLDWFAGERTGHAMDDLVVGLAILCHDFGKPFTTTSNGGRVISHGHEQQGAAPTRRFLERLTNQHPLIEDVIPLVLYHLHPRQLYDAQASDAAVRKLARQVRRIDRLVRVARADHAGRPPKPFDGFPAGEWLLKRAKQLEVETQAPPPIVMGRHLLELGVRPGPDMGRLLDACYDAQLNGAFSTLEEGLAYVRAHLLPGTR
ncbi:MAG: HD domain-containing protein [Nitrospira sp.]|nr:HD domain-containing protein [Nitrospira sp.]